MVSSYDLLFARQSAESLKLFEEEKAATKAARKANIWGGATPEETFDTFLSALKSGDVALASKYVGGSNGDKEFENYIASLTPEQLQIQIKEYEKIRKEWMPPKELDTTYGVDYDYQKFFPNEDRRVWPNGKEMITPAGYRKDFVSFGFNPENQIWHIVGRWQLSTDERNDFWKKKE
ncbi:MAG: hypothetical protein HYW78_03235 [Parcubacteria group bacterium]|nr:hypothetical protein [Parcubacteria group bacterium]